MIFNMWLYKQSISNLINIFGLKFNKIIRKIENKFKIPALLNVIVLTIGYFVFIKLL